MDNFLRIQLHPIREATEHANQARCACPGGLSVSRLRSAEHEYGGQLLSAGPIGREALWFSLFTAVDLVDSESESILRPLCGKTSTGGTFQIWDLEKSPSGDSLPALDSEFQPAPRIYAIPTPYYTLDKCTTTFCIHNFPRRHCTNYI